MLDTAIRAATEEQAADIVTQKVLEFCHLLRAHGMEVTAGRIIDTFRSLQVVGMFRRQDLYTLLEANLVAHTHHRELFQQLFAQFWRGPSWVAVPDPCIPAIEDGCDLAPPHFPQDTSQMAGWDRPPATNEEEVQHSVTLYSPQEVLTHKDFGKMAEHELLRVQRLIMTMARQMATRLSRRKHTARNAHLIDAGRTLRKSLRYGGEVVQLVRRSPKIGKTKMVLLCDVSGSMDVYSRFLIQFLYGLQNGLRGVETIVFSTRLTRITSLLRRRHISAALDLVADTVRDWSGGTKIGTCLQAFNDTMAPGMVTHKTLVIIISDGWDTGDTAILDEAMAQLRGRAMRVIWLNPLLGSANYQPLCKGIQTALPYVHDFLSVHNVESLRRLGGLVQSLM